MPPPYCLNPCFSGGWSRSSFFPNKSFREIVSLNPCFSGGWSRSIGIAISNAEHCLVLILVLVEDGLGGCEKKSKQNRSKRVLILVLVEDGLGGLKRRQANLAGQS